MSDYKRTAHVRAGTTDAKAGTFEAVLFTGGEASDGHILDVRGAGLPEKIPMFVNHFPDPTEQVGSFYPRLEGGEVIARGEIFMGGEGAAADIRRDLMAKIAAGHVGQVSGRWDADPDNTVARTSLPKDHPAHVPGNAKGAKRFGQLFQKWRAMEGSIVGLGADPAAVMRFARDEAAPDHVREFWAAQAEDEEQTPEARTIAEMRERLDAMHERLAALETDDRPTVEDAPTEGNATREAAVQGDALARVVERIDAQLNERDTRVLQAVDEMIATARGKVKR